MGEAAIPLRLYDELRRRGIETWLVAHDSDRDELAARFASEPDRLFLTPSLPGMGPVFRLGERLPDGPRAIAWALTQLERQQAMVPVIRRLVAELGIDVVHHPIGVSPSVPSPLRRLGAPLVVGPLNGGMVMPPAFRERDPRLARLTQALRRPVGTVAHRLVRGRLEASAVLVANELTRQMLPGPAQRVSSVLPENALVLADWPQREDPAPGPDAPVRFVFLGRLVPYKSPDLALHAFARARAGRDMRLEILGDGPMRAELEDLAAQLGVADSVDFRGWLTKAEVSERLRASDVFVFPSLREPGGIVVLEAMATGIPCIVADWGGPGEYVTEGTGVRIDVSSPGRFLDELTEAMLRLARDPGLRGSIGSAARARVRDAYDWDAVVGRLVQVYREVSAPERRQPGGRDASGPDATAQVADA